LKSRAAGCRRLRPRVVDYFAQEREADLDFAFGEHFHRAAPPCARVIFGFICSAMPSVFSV
jgi:hypothetical protein